MKASTSQYMDLTDDQKGRANWIFRDNKIMIESKLNYNTTPVICTTLAKLLEAVQKELIRNCVNYDDIALTGGAASFVVCKDHSFTDLDIVIRVDNQGDWNSIANRILTAVHGTIRTLITGVEETQYILKQFKMNDKEKWSLISLNNRASPIDLKFVYELSRDYEFSTDSFELSLLSNRDHKLELSHQIFSNYPDVHKAIEHVQQRKCDIVQPGLVYGGGFLKYCLLKSRGYGDARTGDDLSNMIKTIVGKFFNDHFLELPPRVPNRPPQSLLYPFERYLSTHFPSNDVRQKFAFLDFAMMLISQFLSASTQRDNILARLRALNSKIKIKADDQDQERREQWSSWYNPYSDHHELTHRFQSLHPASWN